MASNNNLADGFWINEVETKYGQMFFLNIERDNFINWLDSLQPDENGKVSLKMGCGQSGKWYAAEAQQQSNTRNNRGGNQRGGNSRGGQRQAPQQNYARQNGGRQRQAPRNQQQPARGQRQAMQNPFVNDQDEADGDLPF